MKIFLRILGGLLAVVLLFLAYVQFFPAPRYEEMGEDFATSTDSAVIARGEYLVFGPARCVECHVHKDYPIEGKENRFALAGGHEFKFPLGTLYTANLTPDEATGIGAVSNATLERAIRHSIGRDDRVMPPFMGLTHISDEDMVAIISYLRSMPAVVNDLPWNKYSFMGKLARKFFLKPSLAEQPIPATVPEELSIAYGGYLVNELANCDQCHTPFDMSTMGYNKELHLAGGSTGGTTESKGEYIFNAPNLTPDPKTGHLTDWTEERFVERFGAGKVFPESIMPWDHYKEMTDQDVRAMYRYLQSLAPIENDPGPHVQLVEKEG